MKNILTIDIEDWLQSSVDILGPEYADVRRPVEPSEHAVSNTRHLLSILQQFGVRATCFVLGTVAEVFPFLVREIHAAGHEVASHGYGHDLVYRLTPGQFRSDLRRSFDLLESLTGESVRGYRAPYFSITQKSQWALDVLTEEGIVYDSSIFPIHRGLYGIPYWNIYPHAHTTAAGRLFELPPSTIKLVGQNLPAGGGGYFRLLPYVVFREAIRSINRRGQPAVFYLHPYELDTQELHQPLKDETRKTRFARLTQGLNRSRTETKLKYLLRDFEWIPVSKWIAQD